MALRSAVRMVCLLEGRTLYVVQSSLNRVAVIRLSNDYRSGVVTHYLTQPFASNPALGLPTTIADSEMRYTR